MDIIERKPIIKMFPKQKLIDWGLPYSSPIIYNEFGNIIAKGSIFSDIIIERNRWSNDHEIIFSEPEDNSKIWKTYYSTENSVPFMEYPDQEIWFSYNLIRCVRVRQVEKVWEEVLED